MDGERIQSFAGFYKTSFLQLLQHHQHPHFLIWKQFSLFFSKVFFLFFSTSSSSMKLLHQNHPQVSSCIQKLRFLSTLLSVLVKKRLGRYSTGLSGKNGKSKTVCAGFNFHKNWILSAVLGSELAANQVHHKHLQFAFRLWLAASMNTSG